MNAFGKVSISQSPDFFNVSMGSLIERTEHQTATPATKDDVDDIFDEDIRMLARNKMKDASPEEREQKKKQLKK